jgi:hypothetical protein
MQKTNQTTRKLHLRNAVIIITWIILIPIITSASMTSTNKLKDYADTTFKGEIDYEKRISELEKKLAELSGDE